MKNSRTLRPIAAAAVTSLVLATGCGVDMSAPDHLLPGYFSVAPTFESGATGIVDVSAMRVLLERRELPSMVLDTVVPITSDSVDLSFKVRVRPNETLTMTIELFSPENEIVFRGGPVEVTPSTDVDTPPPAVDVTLEYTGPGADAQSVEIRDAPEFVAAGDTVEFVAVALDDAGNVIPGTPIAWQSLNPGLAVVPDRATGLVIGTSTEGLAQIEAALLTGPTAVAGLQVRQLVEQVTVTPATASLSAGQTVQLTASAVDGSGNPITDAKFIWLSSDQAVATVDTTGLVAARTGGIAVITAAAEGIPGNAVVTVSPLAAAAGLAILTQPSDREAGQAFSPAVDVEIVDAGGNVVTSAADQVTLAIGANPGVGSLSGTVTVRAHDGIASFAGLSIDKAGTGYTLAASSGSLAGATSDPFDITAAAPDRLVFSQQPAGSEIVAPMGPIEVSITDAFGNVVPTASDPVFVALEDHPSGGGLMGTPIVNAVGGVATFTDFSVDRSGTGFLLTARSGSLGSATSDAFGMTFTWQGPLASGSEHNCATQVTGYLYCWGDAEDGQLGLNPVCVFLDNCGAPLPTLQTIGPVDAIAAGGYTTCAQQAGQDWRCWGDLPGVSFRESPVPAAVPGTASLVSLSLGDRVACGVAGDQSASCWGEGFVPLGNGTQQGSDTPVLVSGGLSFVSVSVGGSHACGLTSGGSAYCWGFNDVGQLGTTTAELCYDPYYPDPLVPGDTLLYLPCSSTPVPVGGGLSFQALAAAGSFFGFLFGGSSQGYTCGLATDNNVYCWGFGGDDPGGGISGFGNGQWLGFTPPDVCPVPDPFGPPVYSVKCALTPGLVGGGLSFSAVEASRERACALTTGGLAYCWGVDILGDGVSSASVSPVAVSGGLVFGSLVLGGNHTCGFVPSSGEMYCWGDNDDGQLGRLEFDESLVPVMVMKR